GGRASEMGMGRGALGLYWACGAGAAEGIPARVVPAAAGHGRLGQIVPPGARLERVAGGFEFTEGPVWTRDGALLFSSPNTNTIYRWAPPGTVTVFHPKSGYTRADIGRHPQPRPNRP